MPSWFCLLLKNFDDIRFLRGLLPERPKIFISSNKTTQISLFFLTFIIILWFSSFVEIFPTQYEKGKIDIGSASIFQN